MDTARDPPARVAWSLTPAESRLLRLPLYAFAGVAGGMLLIVVGGGALVLTSALLAGNYGSVALVALLALVGGPLSLLYLWPMVRDPDQRPSALDDLPPLSPPFVALAAVAGATTILAGTQIHPSAPVVVLAVGFGSPVIVALFGSSGRVDTGAGTLTVDGRDADLDSLAGYRSVEIGDAVGFWLRYRRPPLGTPRWLVVPAAVAPALEDALETGVTADAPSSRSRPLALRLTLAIFGCGCLAVAVGLWWVGGQYAGDPVALLPGAGLAAVFGALFLWLAVRD